MFYLLVAGAGVSVALQQVLNANLQMELGSPWWAGFISFLIGAAAMLAVAITLGDGLSEACARTAVIATVGN
jgi:bacterial/archaeal transporter family-2 protein